MRTLEKGTFLFTLDTELAWGTGGNPKYQKDYERTREVITELLSLLTEYNISATWAIVGHLFLESCEPQGDQKHPEIKRKAAVDDWFRIDPATDVTRDPLWYAPDVIAQIKNNSVYQEIGSHSFSHIVSEDQCDEVSFVSELHKACEVAQKEGLSLKSFVYPKNVVKYPQRLPEYGFKIYRSEDNVWYANFPRLLRRIGHGIDNYLVPSAPVGDIRREGDILSIPGNYFYVHRRSWAKYLPISMRVRKAVNGIKKASHEKKVFHLWCHPFNLASDPEGLLSGLRQVFIIVRSMIDKGELDNKTMGQLAELYD